jgi:choline dehydrogenase-like flavoprotein
VLRINFDGHRASGVTVRDANGMRSVEARREVILAAGALHSPRLLQVSGIGPGQLLNSLGIPTRVDAPEVGRNLHDHRYLPAMFNVTTGSLNREFGGLRLLGNLARYFLASKGPMTHAAHEIAGFAKMRPEASRPDCQIGGSLYTIEATEKGLAIGKEHGLTIGGYYTQPKSKGAVMIRSSNIDTPADIQANYLSAQEDQEAAVALVHFVRALVAQPALARFIKAETFPGPGVQTDEQIIDTFMEHGSTTFHYAGTCRMGADARSVLDPQLRVRGVEGLRVADASIMPALVSGNTNGPAMAIGLRASELILETRTVQPEMFAES